MDSILDRTGQVWTALEVEADNAKTLRCAQSRLKLVKFQTTCKCVGVQAGQLEHKVMLKPNPVVLDNQCAICHNAISNDCKQNQTAKSKQHLLTVSD